MLDIISSGILKRHPTDPIALLRTPVIFRQASFSLVIWVTHLSRDLPRP